MIVGVHRRDYADADPCPLGKFDGDDGKLFVLAVEFFFQPEAAHRAEIAFDMQPQHLLELFAQVAWNQVQRLFKHRAAFDRVDRIGRLQAAMHLLGQGAFTGADRAHEIEHLPALFALQGRRVKITHDLRDGLFDAEKFVGEEIVDLHGFVFIEPLDMWIAAFMDVAAAWFHNDVINPGVRQFGDGRIFLDLFDVAE